MTKEIVSFASPTLAKLKCGNIFTYGGNDIKKELHRLNLCLNKAGIYVDTLSSNCNGVLVYVYRKDMLKKELLSADKRTFIEKRGYDCCGVESCVHKLKERFAECDGFPHEIGLFLGYPLGDVIGFIQNKGKNYILNGYWKVYCNEKTAINCFCRYQKCTAKYCKLYHSGVPLEKLIV